MSGLVFVQDACGRPLMPTSASYARVLLRTHRAYRQPHPAFFIIKLTQTILEPVLQPVLLGIIPRPAGLSLLVFTMAAGTFPLLHIIVNTQTSLPVRSPISSSPREILAASIGTLNGVIPISHIAWSDPQHQIPHLTANIAAWGMHVLDVSSDDLTSDPGLASRYRTFQATVQNPIPAHAVACYRPRLQVVHHSDSSSSPAALIVQAHHGDQTITGITADNTPDTSCLLTFPTNTSLEAINWMTTPIEAEAIINTWNMTAVVFLPIIPLPDMNERND